MTAAVSGAEVMDKNLSPYNLLEENWIPVLGTDGSYCRLSIKGTLMQSGRIRQIATSNPMDRLAIFRFLLALLYWCQGNPPPDMDAGLCRDGFPVDWFAKLDDDRECFNLLGEGGRFYQYRKEGDKPLSVNYLLQEVPTGTNMWHFRHSTDGVNGLCRACCAMGLLRLPVFSTSGGKGKSPGINAKPPVYVVPLGETLRDTLRLAWKPVTNLGKPCWLQPSLPLPNRGELPLLTGLTWLPRRVWLEDRSAPESECISCGRREGLIRRCVFAGLGTSKAPGRTWCDPHVVYVQKGNDLMPFQTADALVARDAAAGHWAALLAAVLRDARFTAKLAQGIPAMAEGGFNVRLWIVAFSTVRNDKYLEAAETCLPVPQQALLSGTSDEAVRLEQWHGLRNGLARTLTRRLEETRGQTASRENLIVESLASAIRPHVEGRVVAKAGELLSGGIEVWQRAAREYEPMMNLIAGPLAPGYTTKALLRRRRIAGTIPSLQTEPAARKSRRKQREDQ